MKKARLLELIQVTTSNNRWWIAAVLALSALVVMSYLYRHASGEVDFSSPEATIETYCEARKSGSVSTVKRTFHPAVRLEEKSFARPLWTDCKIIEIRETKSVGKYLGHGLSIESGDVEVVVEVKMIDPARGNPFTKFWYTLRNIKGEWKITSTAHIPDANYPRLD